MKLFWQKHFNLARSRLFIYSRNLCREFFTSQPILMWSIVAQSIRIFLRHALMKCIFIFCSEIISVIASFKKLSTLSHSGRDTLIVITGVVLSYLISLYFNLSEEINAWLAGYENVQLDEIPFTLFVYAALSLWFSQRRMDEIRAEIQRRKKTESQLSSSRQLYKTLFDGDLTGNVVIDLSGRIGMYNRAFERICGVHEADQSIEYLFSFNWDAFVDQLQYDKEINFNKLKINRQDQLACYVSARFVYVSAEKDVRPGQVHAYLVDMTEQCTIEIHLERTLKENRVLARHAMQLQEQERKFIASEIHDETGQYLTAIRMDALALQRSSPDQASMIATRIASNTQHVQQSIRALIKHLRPPSLDSLGLIGAVEQLINDWKKLNPAVKCNVSLEAGECTLNDDTNIVAYRVIQEALTNITRHARATEIWINISMSGSLKTAMLKIEIRDNGTGMDTLKSNEGVGLVGMRERIETLKGSFRIMSGENAGTLITGLIPLQSFSQIENPANTLIASNTGAPN